MDTAPATETAEHEVVSLCRDLIRIDSTNTGDDSGPGERKAAEYVATKLDEVGLDHTMFESAPRRASVVTRLTGADPTLPALLVHGHLDVVPAQAADWRLDPFSAELEDGCVWGRGAVDMKDMDAMMLAVLREFVRSGRKPKRDIVFAWLADEEAGGRMGAKYFADHHADLLDGCDHAISEVGGYSFEISPDLRFYLVETAQKGLAWMRLVVDGTAGHGSMTNDDNPVTELAEVVARLGSHEWPTTLTTTVQALLEEICDAFGIPFDAADPHAALAMLGPVARFVGATMQHTANPSKLDAGYKVNVIPGRAVAEVDGRFLPGGEDEFFATVDELIGPRARREMIHHDIAVETSFDGPLVEAMIAALAAEDPAARAVPYCLSGGTDNKTFAPMGIRGFGFVPLRLPPELDFPAMFHGIDERVPTDALTFGARVLDRLLTSY